MKPTSHSETSTNSVPQALWQLTVLISDLRRTVYNFEASIEAEEGRAHVVERAKANYATQAGDFKGRRDNLLLTISMLENHLKRAEARAAWLRSGGLL
jgi:hypothetical protein